MKVLILTANNGGGHNSVAESLSLLLNKNNIQNEIYDMIYEESTSDNEEYANKNIQKSSKSFYNNLIKYTPFVYGMIYKTTNIKNFKIASINILQINKLTTKIEEYKPDVVISIHALAVSYLLNYFKDHSKKLPFIQILMDFNAHYEYIDKIVDAFVTGSEYTNYELMSKGIKKKKLYNYGIPVSDKFFMHKNVENRELTNEILIMLGSMGFQKNIEKIYDFIDKTDKIIHFVTGSNKDLKEILEKKYSKRIKDKKIYIYGFINNVYEIMKKCDIIITKTGGTGLTECLLLRKPMIFVNPIPGQEEENIKIMERYGVGINAIKKDINNIVNKLYNNPSSIDNMISGIEDITKTYSKDKLVELIKQLYTEYKEKQ